MRIREFQNFIKEIPFRNQAFDIKKANWKIETQQKLIDKIFNGAEVITLSRQDLINSSPNIKEFIIKTLMWGYPTKGRGRNIEKMLEPENFEHLTKILTGYKDNEISNDQLVKDIKSIPGLGLSTITKFTHFLNTTIEGNKAVILDIQIIEVINLNRFSDLSHLKGITYDNASKQYPEYLKTINNLSLQIEAEPDQVEMFLFTFGRTLSPNKNTLKNDIEPKDSEKNVYRKRLIEAYKNLISIREDLFTGTLNIAMAGELNEIDRVFEEGDEFEFEMAHFKNSKDVNLTKLVEFQEQLDNLMHSIANVNAIKESEL